MTAYLIRRAFQMSIVVMMATFAIYLLLNIAPGGPLSGLQLAADRRTRVSEADIARLEAYLGLDKPMILRYMTWLIGDDWLGANWVYVSLTQYGELDTGKDGTPLVKVDRHTGEQYYTFTNHRFWADPGVALLNPGYLLWVWGEETAPNEFQAAEVQVAVANDGDGCDHPRVVGSDGNVLIPEKGKSGGCRHGVKPVDLALQVRAR